MGLLALGDGLFNTKKESRQSQYIHKTHKAVGGNNIYTNHLKMEQIQKAVLFDAGIARQSTITEIARVINTEVVCISQ